MERFVVAFIGVGTMGKPMVRRLIAAGHTVRVYNRSRPAVEEVVADGAVASSSAADAAAGAAFVLTALPTPESVDDVYRELADVSEPGQLFIDHSTVRPDQNRRWAAELAARRAAYLDAPVSGGPRGATDGTLTVMVGGAEDAFLRAVPVLSAFGRTITRCGPIGAGQVVKLVNQLLVGVHTAAIAEAAVFGVKLGADPRVLLDLIGQSYGGSAMMTRQLPRFIARDFSPATTIDLLLKDLGLIHQEARISGVPLLLGSLAEQRFIEAHGRGWGADDMAALVRLSEEPAGVEVGH